MIFTIVAVLLIAVGLVPLIVRDLERARRRAWLRRNLHPLRVQYEAFAATVAAQLMPALTEFARAMTSMEPQFRRIREALDEASKKTVI